jgi:tellurite methyltransferase
MDLGCGAGRDARQLLRAGWRVIAVDREPAALETLTAVAGPELSARLETRVEDLARLEIPPCDLVNASLCLPFLAPEAFAATWHRIVSALSPGARFSAMLFGDRDESASDATMTCLPPERIEADLDGFEIEHWLVKEEETQTALGEPRHMHLIEVVARRIR